MSLMRFKVGDKVKIISNESSHEFKPGEIVTITEVFENNEDYRADNSEDFWFVRDTEIARVGD